MPNIVSILFHKSLLCGGENLRMSNNLKTAVMTIHLTAAIEEILSFGNISREKLFQLILDTQPKDLRGTYEVTLEIYNSILTSLFKAGYATETDGILSSVELWRKISTEEMYKAAELDAQEESYLSLLNLAATVKVYLKYHPEAQESYDKIVKPTEDLLRQVLQVT